VEPNPNHPVMHPGRCAKVLINDVFAGHIGEVHPKIAENYGITEQKTTLAYLFLEVLFATSNPDKKYKASPRFPASMRDLALICPDELPVRDIQDTIAKAVGAILESIELFDVYRGKQTGEGKKSAAFSLTLRANDRTLTDEECDAAVKRALKALKEIGAEIRS
jgi:phenylalanyl-tRNA synthetase beta chain